MAALAAGLPGCMGAGIGVYFWPAREPAA